MSVVGTDRKVLHADCAIEGTASTFAAICGSDPVLTPEATKPSQPRDISGIISIVGDVTWSLIFSFPAATASALAETFAGIAIPYDSSDMSDVIGELANVVAGDVVCRLEARRVRGEMSIPAVARGSSVEMSSPGAKVKEIVRFTVPEGDFWLEVAAA